MTKTGRGTVEAPGTLVQKRANENRALLEIAPWTIRTMLEYKCQCQCQWYGSTLVLVDPAHTSETCSACGAVDARKAHRRGPLRVHDVRRRLRR
jgi:putative transposase